MGRPNARKRAAREKPRNDRGHIISSTAVAEELVYPEDWELLGLSEAMISNASRGQFLEWKTDADKGLRGTYNSNSRTTQWRKRRAEEEDGKNAKKSRSLTEFGFTVGNVPVAETQKQEELELIKSSYEKLTAVLSPQANSTAPVNQLQIYELCRQQAVKLYFSYRLKGYKKMESSDMASKTLWVTPSPYRSRAIRLWAKEYMLFGELTSHRKGKHAKRFSLLNDEDIAKDIRSKIRLTKPEQRNLIDLKKYIDSKVIPDKLGVPGNISTSVVWRYMHEWGYIYRKNRKDIYYDGHERKDVVAYRLEWAKRMMKYREFMDDFNGEDGATIIEPDLPSGQKKVVMVTHDESTFYANDGKVDMWLEEGENPIRKKGPGQSIMVSEFQCACHGTMRIKNWSSRHLFLAGANREGYWKNEDMIKQLTENVIPIFNNLHPNCMALFLFDQSSNHNAYKSDALLASRMGLNEKAISDNEAFLFRGTEFELDGDIYPQNLYCFPEVVKTTSKGKKVKKVIKTFKGIKRILQERQLWLDEDPYVPGKKWRLSCNNVEEEDHRCCARHFLTAQPDFKAQKTAIQEEVEKSGHIFELYTKFHCECNWIERYWGAAKRIARTKCDYTYKSLQQNLESYLDDVSPKEGVPTQIRHFYRKAWRYIAAYSQGMDAREATEEVKKFTGRSYKSHRRLGIED